MFLFAILLLLNSTLTNDFLFAYRKEIGGFPLNILDGMLALVFLQQLLSTRNKFRADRVHPLFIWSVSLLVLSIFIGIAGAAIQGTGAREYVTAMRNLLVLPASIFIGYTVAKTPRSAKTVTYIWLWCSLASAVIVMFLIRGTSEAVREGKSFDELRLIRYGGDTGLTLAAFLVFAGVSRIRVFPRYLSRVMLVICTVGIFGVPHRGSYVTGVFTLLFAALVLARANWGRRLTMTFLGIIVMSSLLFGGVAGMSQLTGRDFKTYVVERRLKALLPFYDEETKTTVTATRLPGILAELKVWSESPVIGKGFAISSRVEAEVGAMGMNHNVWTSALAQYGPIGLAAFLVPIFGCIIVGYRMLRDSTDPHIAMFGALAAIMAFVALFWGSLSLSINQQRLGMMVGLMFGMAFRVRAMQLTLAREGAASQYESGASPEYGYDYNEYGGMAQHPGDSVHT
ncbi:MAG: hypothetical protein JWN40_3438 [Phycisphaerales bacterium]|nr:hypothetical protein [Phycisphaerales bacterium]